MRSGPPGTALRPASFTEIEAWPGADHAGGWQAFRAGAASIARAAPELRAAVPPEPALRAVCERALALPDRMDRASARQFFESAFAPFRVVPTEGGGFLTGYYEPCVEGSTERSGAFTAPVLPRPADLCTFGPGESHDAVPAAHSAGRLGATGMETYPDRATIEADALKPTAKPVVWLRDWTEVFLIHVQGSARVRLRDGSSHRLVYAGRNGHPYTSIGRRLIEAGLIARSDMSLAVLKSWLRENGQEAGQPARLLMQENRSYIFFRMEPVAGVDHGPIGGAGVPLQALQSIAVDRTLWSYGLPFWIESPDTLPGFGVGPLRRLFIAQDTGSAIVGPARADLFLGSGDAAGVHAGAIRHAAAFTVLLPRSP